MISVFLADDHAIVRSGLRQLFAGERDIEIVGEAEGIAGILALLSKQQPDVLVLDINMPGNPTPAIVREITQTIPGLAIVIFTMYPEDSHAVSYLRNGALAFINKRRSIMDVLKAVRAASKGQCYLSDDLKDYLFLNDIDLSKAPDSMLSEREIQVVRKLSGGLRSKEIASQLAVSQSTVNTYVQRIKIKLGVKSIVDVVEFARDNGLIG